MVVAPRPLETVEYAGVIRNRSDQLGKNILHDLLSLRGGAWTETEVPPGDALRIDLWFVPDETRRDVKTGLTGILARMADAAACIELWSDGLDVDEFHACLHKRYAWHRALESRDKRKWQLPTLWHVCAGCPENAIKKFGLELDPAGPSGVYRMEREVFDVRLIVIPELPRVRETVLLRLLGRTPARRRALEDLKALPPDALERTLADRWLVRLKYEVPESAVVSQDDQELIMDVQAWLEERDRKLVQDSEAQALRKGRFAPLRHLFERRLRRELTKAEQAALSRRLDTDGVDRVSDVVLDLSPDALADWLAKTNEP